MAVPQLQDRSPAKPAESAEPRPLPRRGAPSPTVGWELLAWVAGAFVVVGLTDLLLGWIPVRLGNPEWEFGTVSRTLDNLPITLLGLALLHASVAARGIDWALRATSLLALVLAGILLVGLVVYALDLPLAFRVVTDPAARSGLERAVVKALVQGTLYPTVLLTIGIKGIRQTVRARPRLS
jgi:hypothetical protein